jgi:uncharacterized protein
VIIDCHCHAGTGTGAEVPGPVNMALLSRYLRRARAAGIARTVLFPSFQPDYAVANRQVAEIVAARPDEFYGFAFVHAARDAGRIDELVATAVTDYGFRGIKVHRRDAPITREVCQVARRYRLPVLYDPMGEVDVVAPLAEQFPDVAFILPHLGSFADDWTAQRAVIDHLDRYPNVYADTSAVRRFDLLVEAVRRAGPVKLLFGSDGPWLHPGVELAKVRALRLGPSAERLVLGGTLRRLIARVRRPAHPRQRPLAAVAAPGR